MLSTDEVFARISKAIERKKGLSLVRVGDGESIFLGYPELYGNAFGASINAVIPSVGLPFHSVKEEPQFPEISRETFYAHPARPELIEAIERSDILGVQERMDGYFGRWQQVFNYHNILPRGDYASANINYDLFLRTDFIRLLRDHKTLIIGNVEPREFKLYLGNKALVGFSLRGEKDLWAINQSVCDLLEKIDYDIAIIGAGGAACIWADKAKQCGKVGLDVGAVIDACCGKNTRSLLEQPPYDRLVL